MYFLLNRVIGYLVTRNAHVAIVAIYRISPTSIDSMTKEITGAIWDVLLEKGYVRPDHHKHRKIGRTQPEGLKTDRSFPIVSVHWTEGNMLLYRHFQRMDLFFKITKRAVV